MPCLLDHPVQRHTVVPSLPLCIGVPVKHVTHACSQYSFELCTHVESFLVTLIL